MAKAKKSKSSKGGGGNDLLLKHGEKIGLGIVGVLCLALMVFGFVGKPSVEESKSATALGANLKNVQDQHSGITYEAAPVPPSVEPAPVPTVVLGTWVSPLYPLQGVRSEPKLVKAEKVRAVAGRALFNMGGNGAEAPAAAAAPGAVAEVPAGSTAKVEDYAVVTGLIPLADQAAIYDDTFRDTLKMPGDERENQDKPEYYRIVVERAEATPGVADDKLEWQAVNEADNAKVSEAEREPALVAKKSQWAEQLADIVPPEFTEPALVYGHPLKEEELPWLPPRLPKVDPQWAWDEVGHPEIKKGFEAFSTEPAAPADAAKAAAAPVNQPATPAAEVDPAEALKLYAETYKYRMFRYWDFTVEPGKTYKYRVTLVVRNPNRGYTKQYLKSEDLAVGEFRPADPIGDPERPVSVPSEVVTVPGKSSIAVGGVVANGFGTNKTGEDQAKIVLTIWENTVEAIAEFKRTIPIKFRIKRDRDAAIEEAGTLETVWAGVDFAEFSKEFSVYRGSWLSMRDAATNTHPLKGGVQTLKTVRFNTNFLVVDMRGGQVLGGKPTTPPKRGAVPTFTAPAEYLLLDPMGRLVIRTEIGDLSQYRKKVEAAADTSAAGDAAGKMGDGLEVPK